MTINWEDYKFGKKIACVFKPRGTGLTGKTLLLTAAWKIESDEKYPGEYALSPADRQTEEFFHQVPMALIASGDVEPLPVLQLEEIVVVTNDYSYRPDSGVILPYVVGKSSTTLDCSIIHEAVCASWRHFNQYCFPEELTHPFSGSRKGLLNIAKPVTRGIHLTMAERDYLYTQGLNHIRFFPGRGCVVDSSHAWVDGKVLIPKQFPLDKDLTENSLLRATLNFMYYHNVDMSYQESAVPVAVLDKDQSRGAF